MCDSVTYSMYTHDTLVYIMHEAIQEPGQAEERRKAQAEIPREGHPKSEKDGKNEGIPIQANQNPCFGVIFVGLLF